MNSEEIYLADAIEAIEEVLASGGEFRLFPRGTSMLPLIVQSRDSVVIRRDTEIPARKHDIAFYRRNDGHFVLHRVMDIREGEYIMCGDNQTLLEAGIKKEQIIAYVSEIYRKKKIIKKTNRAYRAYVFLWTLMPLRRVVLFVRRILGKIRRFFRGIFAKRS